MTWGRAASLSDITDLIASLAWPSIVATGGYYYREEIRGLFKRVQKIGLGGAQFETTPAQVPTTVEKNIVSNQLRDVGLARTPFMSEVERRLLADLDSTPDEKRLPLLVRLLAQARIELACERIYSIIFGSQIRGLRELEKAGGQVPIKDAQEFFGSVKTEFPEFYDKIDFWDWISYLTRSDLVVTSTEDVELTPFGRDFLLYLAARGLPNRHF